MSKCSRSLVQQQRKRFAPVACLHSARVQTNWFGQWQSGAAPRPADWPLLTSASRIRLTDISPGHSKSKPPCDQKLHFKFMNICIACQGCSVLYFDAFCSILKGLKEYYGILSTYLSTFLPLFLTQATTSKYGKIFTNRYQDTFPRWLTTDTVN